MPGLVGLGDQRFHFVHVALENQVRHQRRIQHDLDRRDPADAVDLRNQALRHQALQIQRQVHQQLLAALVGEKVDDPVERLVGAVGVQRRQAQVTGFGKRDRMLHGFAVANLTDQDHIRRLAQGILQRNFVGLGIHADLALGDQAIRDRARIRPGSSMVMI